MPRRRIIVAALVAIPVLAVGWWLGSPLFLDTEVSEAAPVVEAAGTAVASGRFQDYDELHQGKGTATIHRLEDGTLVLRLEDFEVTNGPGLRVYLVPDPSPTDSDDIEGYVDLGALKGNIGDQNYQLPPGVDPADFGSVVIYCAPFSVIFSIATLGS
jgi:hypothetical protein